MAKYNLSEGILRRIMAGDKVVEPVVQVLGSKKINSTSTDKERYRLLLSDGQFTIAFALLATQASSGGVNMFSIVKIKNYTISTINSVNRPQKVLFIVDMEVLTDGDLVGHKIGDPVSLTDDNMSTRPNQPKQPNPVPATTSTSNGFGGASSSSTTTNETSMNTSISESKLISPIIALTPYHNKWVIKARVVNKSDLRTWSNSRGEGKLFSFDLIDETGEIRCTAFRELADKFFNFIQVDKVYYLSKCQIKTANKKFNQLKNEYEMTVTHDTLIEECMNNDDNLPQVKYNFVPLDKVATLEVGALVDVVGICKAASDLMTLTSKTSNRELKKREVQLVDQSKTAMTLTLWGSQAESFEATNNPVIVIKGAKVGEFGGGKNLSALQSSQFKVNPDIPECYRIKGWFDLEGKDVEMKNVSERTGMGSFQTSWMTFKDIQANPAVAKSEKGEYFQTMGTVLLVRSENAVYKACPTADCNKKVVDLENGMYRCEKCSREYPNFKFRLLLSMNVGDWRSNQWVSLFANEAEKVLGKTSEEIGHLMENNHDAAMTVFRNANFKQFIFKCRVKLETYNDEERLKTVVIKVDPINYEVYNAYLIERINKILNF